MARPPPAPLIDPRGYEDLVRETETLAREYCPEWMPPGTSGPDLGRTLIQLFCRMARHVVAALNLQPERAQLAFLQLLGAQRLPPTAARAPLTFRMVEGSTVEARVPAGTQVATTPTEEQPEALVFETEDSLVLTRARLTSLFVRGADKRDDEKDGPEDTYADRSAWLEDAAPGDFPAFSGDTPDEHSLFIPIDSRFNLPGLDMLRLSFSIQAPEMLTALDGLGLEWTFWDGGAWWRVEKAALVANESTATVELTLGRGAPPLTPLEFQGVRACWLRARCSRPPPREKPLVVTDLQVESYSRERKEARPGWMFFNTMPLEASEFLPLGPLPRAGDTFYLECGEVLAWPSAKVKVHVKLSGPPGKVNAPRLVWERWSASAWVQVLSLQDETNALTKDGTLAFELPWAPEPTEVNGQPGHWLRARLVSGGYGTPLEPGAPVVQQLRLERIEGKVLHHRPGTCFTLNDFTFKPVDIREGSERPRPFQPFHRSSDTQPALYLGFDQPFAPDPITLFFQVSPPGPEDMQALKGAVSAERPRLIWEYSSSGHGWRRLAVGDETRAFSHSGRVRFIGPRDGGARGAFGQERYWLRARCEGGAFQVTPRLRRVLTNTTWAVHAVTLSGEVLGSSDGSPEQAFFLTHAPVLLGQRIEVLEPEPPPAEEQATLAREEGPDAVSTPPAGSEGSSGVWVRWHPVPDFHASGPTDRHYVIRHLTGAVRFGDGQHGRIPPRGRQNLRAAWYRTGGGAEGNVPAGALTQLRTTVPYVEGVEQREAATGGTAAETLERMRERAPRRIRHRDRAVTAQDFEDIAREASADVVRVRAITPPVALSPPGSPLPGQPAPGSVWLVIIPSGAGPRPTPGLELLRRVEDHVRARCAPAVDVRAIGPDWVQVHVTATLVVSSLDGVELLMATARAALDRFLHPLTGGDDGDGWDFGRQPHDSDLYALLSDLPGIRRVKTLTFSPGEVSPDALISPGDYELTPAIDEDA
ncbi:putative baseplate assembly protein [Corallococcus sp. 4LFB]|uniref:putative baseplate assembly protein n=1 Tax=Corallococcus sp. 4LFB TaxID=3383249 RepID=UPI0039748F13